MRSSRLCLCCLAGVLCYIGLKIGLKKLLSGSATSNPKPTEHTEPKESKDLQSLPEFKPRSDEEVNQVVDTWLPRVHQRAREFFTHEQIRDVLKTLARNTDSNSDLLEEKCSFWYGALDEHNEATLTMVKPGVAGESVTHVNRVLTFIFASDTLFEQMIQLPKEPFRTSCGDQRCVCLACISPTAKDCMDSD